jgi:3-methyladenine DNA glycosylase AlkC
METKQKEKFSLKDHLFNEPKIKALAKEISAVYPSFKASAFVKEVVLAFPQLELKQRITHIAACLQKYLPAQYKGAIAIILKAMPEPLDPNLSDDDFGDFIYAPYGEFVAKYGKDKKDFATSMQALYEITKRFSVEYAIREFINVYPQEVHEYLLKWCKDKNYHVRRLCSEGTRPTLPWAPKIIYTSEQSLPILHALHKDKTRYVTRSVANHLNDIAKKDANLVLSTLQAWQKQKLQKDEELAFIVKHSLRTLIKDGNAKALAMVGIGDAKGIALNVTSFSKKVKIDTSLVFDIALSCKQAKPLLIDYIVYFNTKAGKFSQKVFKLKHFDAEAKNNYTFSKQHRFIGDASTRTLHPGLHKVAVQVNGSILAEFEFMLVK